MKTTPTTLKSYLLGALVVAGAGFVAFGPLGGSELQLGGRAAEAVVGRPLTPVSYAGVARRTTRRAAVYGATPVVVAPTVITVLPAGCATINTGGVLHYQCGTAVYAPQYEGPNVVYVPVP